MKKLNLYIVISAILSTGCNNEKKDSTKDFFPVSSFIKSQVAHVDTSLYRIIKVVTVDSTADTTYIPREDFRKEAKDFLELPDLAEKKFRKKYTEERMFDEAMNRVIITYLPVKEDQEIQRQEILIIPGYGGEDKLHSIFLDQQKSSADSTTIKRMLWLVDQSFKVVTIKQKKNKADSIITTEVIWNRPE